MSHPYDRYWIGRMYRRVKPQNIAPQPGGKIDPYIGQCRGCERYLSRSECREAEIDECCMYVCRACGAIVDQSIPPF